MHATQMTVPNLTVGLDVSDQTSAYCTLDAKIVTQPHLHTTPTTLHRYFARQPPCRIVLEVGTHSPWISRP